jgi:hypothetical protein
MVNNINNKKETRLLVENWRRLLSDEDNVNSQESQEMLEEGLKQNLALAALAAISLNPFKQTQAKPISNLRARASAASFEMDRQLEQKGVSDSFVKKIIEKKINQYMKDNVVQSKSYDDTHYHVEKLVDLVKKYSALNSDVEDPKLSVIRIVELIGEKVQEKSKSYIRGDDPKIDVYAFNQIVKKFERYIVKKSKKVAEENSDYGDSHSHEVITRDGKRYRLKSKDTSQMNLVNQDLINQQRAAGNKSL